MERQARPSEGQARSMIVLWIVCAFLSGSFMFSYWLGLAGRKNLKAIGDGNPGAMNLWKAQGYKAGFLGVILDFAKGYVPLVWIVHSGYAAGYGYFLIPLALAPIAGHAFSPFLKGKGGKAIAVTFGVWSAISSFEVSLVYAAILAAMKVGGYWMNRQKSTTVESDGMQVVCGMFLLAIYLVLAKFPTAILLVWLGNLIILVYTHRMELVSWLKKYAD
ncbi:glycerol-3-phosphate acyltransferase [Paenibacillus guangzhouensis]|uniref:glycerol-3-phosphate acyltransferase n=1 Tax=Paenibacillus guangzhouensis TaxID=1473112 RepID=UPI001D10D447|nr:glycerol-3-phosphate acyltransferase [Paenibacillus guangzhouensis]